MKLMRVKKALGAAAIGLAAAGCAAGGGSTIRTAPAVTCVLGTQGADVEVAITNQASCAGDVRALASDGLTWYPIAHLVTPGSNGTADGETMSVTCVLRKGSSELTVEDSGGAFYGGEICSSSEQHGWLPG